MLHSLLKAVVVKEYLKSHVAPSKSLRTQEFQLLYHVSTFQFYIKTSSEVRFSAGNRKSDLVKNLSGSRGALSILCYN